MLFVAGVDEAGRGPLAGPVTASCVVLKSSYRNSALTDSKQLKSELRNSLAIEIEANSIAFAVVSVGARRIEELNIRRATMLAMEIAIKKVHRLLSEKIGAHFSLYILTDGDLTLETDHLQEAIVRGDEKIKAISAASVLAKTRRDMLMCQLHERYPGYDLAGHKGYPTPAHKRAVIALGPCPVHRRTFSGVRELL